MLTLPPYAWLLLVALVLAAIDWVAVAREDKRLEYVFKPAALVAVIAAAWATTLGPHDPWQAPWFSSGFLLSLAGDILLLLPARYFLPGLVSFLLAHLAFIAGLNPTPPPLEPALLVLAAIILLVAALVFRALGRALRRTHPGLVGPVALYTVVISLMLLSAWATLLRPEWTAARRLWVIGGGTVFFISDALNGWRRFVAPFRAAALAVMVTYHLGQIALAASIAE